MTTLLKIVAALLMGFLFSACRVNVDNPPEPEPEEEEEEEATPEEEKDDATPEEKEELDHELEVIDSLEIDPYWHQRLQDDAGDVLDTVLEVCVALESESVSDVVLDLTNEGAPRLSAIHMTETAVFIICPEFEEDYEMWFRQSS